MRTASMLTKAIRSTSEAASAGRVARRRLRRLALQTLGASLLAGAVVACTTVQTTGEGAIGLNRKQRMSPLVSEAQLEESAKVAYAEVMQGAQQKHALNVDPAMTARVRNVAGRIIPQVGAFRPDALKWNWQVNVIQSDELNAWCMPGGKIAVYSGIINQLKLTDDELAAILGHEIAHALREHARERASEQATAGLLINVGAAGMGLGNAGADMGKLAYQTAARTKPRPTASAWSWRPGPATIRGRPSRCGRRWPRPARGGARRSSCPRTRRPAPGSGICRIIPDGCCRCTSGHIPEHAGQGQSAGIPQGDGGWPPG